MRALARWSLGCTLVGLLLWGGHGCVLDAPDLRGWFCLSDADCLAPLLCKIEAGVQNQCVPPCFSARDCLADENCSNGFCVRRNTNPPDAGCNQQAKEICNGQDDNCNGQVDDGIFCGQEGEVCDLAANPPRPCLPDLVCSSFSAVRPRICLRLCKNGQCPDSRFECQTLNGDSVCIQQSCQEGTCVHAQKSPHHCDSVGAGATLCRPFYPEGTLAFGQQCAPTDGIHCGPSLQCARRQTDFLGFCTVSCSSDADCKKFAANVVCLPIEGSNKVCFPPCKSNADCPQGMNCQASTCKF